MSEVLTHAVVAAAANITIADTQPTDSIPVNDGGTLKQMDIQNAGVRVVSNDANQTFALGDANTMQTIGATDRTWTIPANASVAFHVGAIIYPASTGAGTITLDPASGVTINSILAQASTASRTVLPGGMAALIYMGGDAWNLTGDIA